MEVGDIFVVFEHSADTYAEFRPPIFLSKYPKERFWHMIYAARADTAAKTLDLFQRHHAGWLYLTDLDLDNPYKDLPTDNSIWQLQLSAAQ